MTDARVIYDLLEEESWPTYAKLIELTGWPRVRIMRALNSLREQGLAMFGPAMNEDGVPHGSGWWRTWKIPPWEKGEAVDEARTETS